MESKQYLWELRTLLTGKMKRDELERIMTYYWEYFHESGPEKETEIMEALGTPQVLAASILGQVPQETQTVYQEEAEPIPQSEWVHARRRSMPIWVRIVLGILLVPVAVSVVLALFALVFSLGVAAVACVAAGVFTSVVGLGSILSNVATTILFAGNGLLSVGFGLLLLPATVGLGKIFGQCTGRFFGWLFGGRGRAR